jgi:hypothetical protein
VKVLLPLMALVAAGGTVAGGGVYLATRGGAEEEAPPAAQATATASPLVTPDVKGQLWRWVNVTVVIPEGSDVYALLKHYGMDVNPPDGGPVLEIVRDANPSDEYASSLLIDADTGGILRDNVRDEDRQAIDQVFQTLAVSPLDLAAAPWPYKNEVPPDIRRDSAGGLSFVRPGPDTGLDVYIALSDPGGVEVVGLRNGRSVATAFLDSGGNLVKDLSHVVPADLPPFERWLAALRLCGQEVEC